MVGCGSLGNNGAVNVSCAYLSIRVMRKDSTLLVYLPDSVYRLTPACDLATTNVVSAEGVMRPKFLASV